MRLMDMVAQTTRPTIVTDELGRTHRFDAVARAAPVVRDCPVRYVLDLATSAQCRDLVRDAHELFRPEDPLLRLPAERFWLEWYSDPDDEGVEGRSEDRMGVLVEADASGRRGTLRVFVPRENAVHGSWASVAFDLDGGVAVPKGSPTLFRVKHQEMVHLNALLDHAALDFGTDWGSYMAAWTPAGRMRCVSATAASAWWAFPVALAFSAMLNSGGLLEGRPSDLQRLNKARVTRKRAALLEHIEVGMTLGFATAADGASHLDHHRRAPRLHYVRGHLVRRSGSTFWRQSHFRGDATLPLARRTVTFTRPAQCLEAIGG